MSHYYTYISKILYLVLICVLNKGHAANLSLSYMLKVQLIANIHY